MKKKNQKTWIIFEKFGRNEKPWILDYTNLDVSNDELFLCIVEQIQMQNEKEIM